MPRHGVDVITSRESDTESVGDLPRAPHRDDPGAVELRDPGEVLEDVAQSSTVGVG